MDAPAQVLEECPACRVEGAFVALYDPSVIEGGPAEGRCGFCGRTVRGGALVAAGRRFRDAGEVRAALGAWARAEGCATTDEFCAANLGGLSPDEVAAAVLAGERVGSTFEVIAWLFPGMAAAMGRPAERDGAAFAPTPTVDALPGGWPTVDAFAAPAGWPTLDAPEPLPDAAAPPAALDPVHTPARALAAVMLADGREQPSEQRFLARVLADAGLPPLTEADRRVWRPAELAAPERPAWLVERMVALSFADRERDPSEWAVIRAFAAAWGEPLAPLDAEAAAFDDFHGPWPERFTRAIRRFFWTEPK